MKNFPGLVTNFVPLPMLTQNLNKDKINLKKAFLGESTQTSSLDHLNQRHIRTSGEFLFLQFWRSVLRFYQVLTQLSNRSNFLGPRPYINHNLLGITRKTDRSKQSDKPDKFKQSKNFYSLLGIMNISSLFFSSLPLPPGGVVPGEVKIGGSPPKKGKKRRGLLNKKYFFFFSFFPPPISEEGEGGGKKKKKLDKGLHANPLNLHQGVN
nr:hypothetical protein [Trentepohlia sp. YN1317]